MAMPDFFAGTGDGTGQTPNDGPALVTRAGRVIGREALAARVAALSERMPGRRGLVAIEGAVCEQAVTGLLAAWRAGHAVALLPAEPAGRADFTRRFAPDTTWRQDGGRWRLEPGAAGGHPPHPELALLLGTSGSTGRARMVRLSAEAVTANARAIATYLGLRPEDRAALVLPLHYSYGLSVLTAHLAAGASVWLHGGSILDADFLGGLALQRCSNLAGVPYSYELLEQAGFRGAALPDLRFMTAAGGRLPPERVRLYDAHLRARGGRLFVMYGQTEATARIAYLPPERAADRPDRIGIAIPGGSLALVDETGRPIAGPGEAGELIYRGPNVMMGYADRRADLARGAEIAALATGDLAERDADGLFRIVGRLKRISKIAGLRIAHDALEAALAAEHIPAAVIGDDERLTAFAEEAVPEPALRARLAALAGLPLSRVQACTVATLPRLASGKPDYAAMRALAADRPTAPDGALEACFSDLFHPRPVTPRDSFASLGGDSLRHLELALALERRLGHLPPGWERMTVAALARLEARPPRKLARIGSDILLRAIAILAVVVCHATLWPAPVGSAVMVVLIGFGLARYQVRALERDGIPGFLAPLPLVLAPYFVLVAFHALAWGQMPWASLLLIGNLGLADPIRHTMLPYLYWFVEIYAQLMLLLAVLFLLPGPRRLVLARPFRFALMLLAAAVLARAVFPLLWPLGMRQIFTLPWIAPVFALGWVAAVARGRQRLALMLLAAAILPVLAWAGGNWLGSWLRYGAVLGAVALLAYVPTLPFPAFALPAALTLAAAGYHVYLLHRLVPELLLAPLAGAMAPWLLTLLSVGGGVALGLAGWRLQRALGRWLPRRPTERPAIAQSGASM